MNKNKIAFAGFMGAILMSVGAANADIATTTYVQGGVQAAKTYTDTQVGTLSSLDTTAKTNTVAAINEVKGAVDTVAGNIIADNDDTAEANKTSTTKYPSMKTMNAAIALAVDGVNGELGDLATEDTINTDFIDDKAVTKAKLADAVQTSLNKADAALPVATYNTQVGTVNKTNMGTTTATTVVGGIKEAIDAAKAAQDAAESAASTASDTYALKTEVGTVSTLTTTAKTNTVAAINELDADIAAMDSAYKAADIAINNKIGAGFDATNTVAKGIADAKTAATTAETNAKTYADGLASNYATAMQGAKADAALPKATYDTHVGTVSATNMGTTATTVVTAIKEVATEAAAANTAITTINNSDVMKSGATKAKIDQIATNTTEITNITKTGGTIDTKISAAQTTLQNSLDGKIDESTTLAGKTLTTDGTTGQLKDAASVAGTKPTDCDGANSGCSYMLMSTGNGFAWTKIVDTYK